MARTQTGKGVGGNGVITANGTNTAGPLPPGEPAGAVAAPAVAATRDLGPNGPASPPLQPASPAPPPVQPAQPQGLLAPVATTSPAAPVLPPPPSPPKPRDIEVHVEVIHGGYTNVKVPVAICPRYEGMALAGPAKEFDRQLDSWLTRAVDLGMIGSGLGQLFPVHMQAKEDRRMKVDSLLMVGMGQPGDFAADDLRYLMSNVTVAVKSMRQDQFSTMLIGTRRSELTIGQAVRGFLQGIVDGYARFRVIADAVTFHRDVLQQSAERPLFISLVEGDEEKAERIFEELAAVAEEGSIPRLQLEPARGDKVDPDPQDDPNATDVDPYVPVTLLRVTKNSTTSTATSGANSARVWPTGIDVFEYSGISDVAAVTVRQNEVNPYLVRELPDRMANASSPEERDALGLFFTNILIPDDFQKLADGNVDLSIEVDETTAAIPWEMAAHKKHSKTSFLGTSAGVSRQFRTLLSPPPGSPPALNRHMKVLVIADPAPGMLRLPHAREEGLAVIDVINHARIKWEGEYDFEVTVRIGSHQATEGLKPLLDEIRQRGPWIASAEPCDPFKLALLIVNEHFDVIHFAGHGAFDRGTRRAGWVFDQDCFLSAQEIFRVRQVPRLVFANACFSSVTTSQNEQRGQLVGLAQAFFARGIPNYIGTAWEVDDACARECARWFYARVLGLRNPDNNRDAVIGLAPPATIGDALVEARRAVLEFKKESSSWGAYQHYGRVTDKLLPLPNALKSRKPR
jgi:CHAT domain